MDPVHRQLDAAMAGGHGDLEWLDLVLARFGDGFAALEIVRDAGGRAVDERCLEVGSQLGVAEDLRLVGRAVTEFVPGIDPRLFELHAACVAARRPRRFERRLTGTDRWFAITTYPAGHDRVLVAVKEITERRRAFQALSDLERRQAYVITLLDALGPLTDPEQIRREATRILGEHLGADRVFHATVAADAADVLVLLPGFSRGSLAPLPARVQLGPTGLALVSEAAMGRTLRADDTSTTGAGAPRWVADLDGLGVRAFVAVPLARQGGTLSMLVVGQARTRAWASSEVGVIEETAHRLWAAVEQARGDAALRESERRFGALSSSIDESFIEAELVRDEQGRPIDLAYLDVNPAFEREVGLAHAAIVGHRRSEHLPPDRDFLEHVAAAIDSGGVHRFEQRVASSGRWYDVTVIPRGGHQVALVLDNVTERRLAERTLRAAVERDGLLVRLEDALRPLDDPEAVHEAAARLLGEHLGVARCISAEVTDGRVAVRGQYTRDVRPLAGSYPVEDVAQIVVTTLAELRLVAVDDVAGDPRLGASERLIAQRLDIAAFMGIAILDEGRWVGSIGVLSSRPRAWTGADQALVLEFGQRTWAAAERARAEAALRASEAKYRLLFETISDAFVLAHVSRLPDGRVDIRFLDINPAFDAVTTGNRASMIGRSAREAVPRLPDHWYEVAERAAFGRETVRFEYESRTAGRWISTLVSPVGEPGDGLVAMVSSDITERRQADALRDARLAQEQAARRDAEAAARLRDEFLAAVSHELRTPLAAILLWSGLLASGRAEGHEREAIDTIQRSAEAQRVLVEDLLDASRIIAGAFELDLAPQPLAPVIAATIAPLRPYAASCGVTIDTVLDAGLVVSLDAPRFGQVIRNLVDNAVRYSEPGGRVDVRLRQAEGDALIEVLDTGAGIAKDDLAQIFDRFWRGDHGRGLGLGLAIAREIVALHGGSIVASSDGPGHGAAFRVRLPLARPGAAARPPLGAPSASGADEPLAGCRVLVVEDDADTLMALQVLLEVAGASVLAARSGLEALAMLHGSGALPDLLLSDVALREGHGFTVAQALRERERRSGRGRVPAVALSASVDDGVRGRAAAAGFDEVLAKPVDADALLAALVGRVRASRA